jgi:hypothetical protein
MAAIFPVGQSHSPEKSRFGTHSDKKQMSSLTTKFKITVSAKDPNGNILEQPYSSEVELLDVIIQNVTVEHNGRFYRYRDLCLQWKNQSCLGNKHVKAVADLYQHGINITYPVIKLGSM